MNQFRKVLAVVCAAAMLILTVPSFTVFAENETDAYSQSLLDAGFPQSYVTKLAALHELHPNWQFEPVLITQLNSTFTFDYVTNMENRASGNTYYNLVTTGTYAPAPWNTLGNANYSPYYDADNTNLYDSGWRKASLQAIRYFMDPRNFLNDYDIFMFESLTYNSNTQTVARVNSALSGSFMGNDAACDNGMTYAQHIWQCGAENNISPVFLAARLKQEQGMGNNPLVNGTLGTTLYNYYVNKPTEDNGSPVWGSVSSTDTFDTATLLSYDGYYNFFNINASGTGRFAIYLNAAIEAKDANWNTKAKAISGGATKIANKYVGDYQDTLYFQKFNTDPRSSRALWGQYMQNIGAPLTEGRTMRNTYSSEGILDQAYLFKIPVYDGMPDSACADPANGNSYYSPSANSQNPDSQPSGTLTYKVQCGSFSVRSNAESLSASLTAAGFSNYISEENGQYIVYAGTYSVQANAQNQVTNIKNAGFDAILVTVGDGATSYKASLGIVSGSGIVLFSDGSATTYATAGTTVSYTLTPADGYRIASVTVGGTQQTVQNNGAAATYSFSMPAAATRILVTFEEIPVTLSYRIRCGIFSVQANANNLSASLTAAGFSNYIENVNGEYIVYAGVYSVLANAEAQLARIQEAGFDACIVTVAVEESTPGTASFTLRDDTSFKLENGYLIVPAHTTSADIRSAFTTDVTVTVSQNAAYAGTNATVSNEAGSATVFVMGDLNGNGEFDSNDTALIRSLFLGWESAPQGEIYSLVGDLNGNGRIDSNDYILVYLQMMNE